MKTRPLRHSAPGAERVIWFLHNTQSLRRSERVRRALHPLSATVQDVGIDHRGPNVLVPKKVLDGSDIVTVAEQVRGKRVAKRVAG